MCVLAPFTAWSACVVPCGSSAGLQTREQPVVVFPAAGAGADGACPPLAVRVQTLPCELPANATCTTCEDGALDGNETDVDCGGDVPADLLDANSTLANSTARIFLSGAPPAQPPAPLAGSTPCARCSFGGACASHSDCSRDLGLRVPVRACACARAHMRTR